MKNLVRILLISSALLGGTAFFSYWYLNQFNQVFDDMQDSFFAGVYPAHSAIIQDTEPVSTTPEVEELPLTTLEITGLPSTTPEDAESALTNSEITGSDSTTDEVIVDEEIVEEPVVFALIGETGLGYLNARTGPGLGFEKILELESGDAYEFIEEEGEWYHLKIDEDTDAWVISTFVELPQD